MKQSSGSSPATAGESRAVAERVTAFLRAQHPTKTADNVAVVTGLSAATVASWFDRGSAPSAYALLALVAVYGPECLETIMGGSAPAWVVQAQRDARQAALEAQLASVQSELAALRG